MTTDKKSDTPRTDAAEAHNASLQLVGGRVLADFARQLERELEAKCKELEKDRARLDWLESHGPQFWIEIELINKPHSLGCGESSANLIREVIDAAMEDNP